MTRRAGKIAFLAGLLALATAGSAAAQNVRLGRAYYADPQSGYRFRYPKDWTVLPVQPDERERGQTCKISGDSFLVQGESKRMLEFTPTAYAYTFEDAAVTPLTGAGVGADEEPAGRRDIQEVIESSFNFDRISIAEDEEVDFRKHTARHRTFECSTAEIDYVLDTWTFDLQGRAVCLLFTVDEDNRRKFLSVYAKCAKTFEETERELRADVSSASPYSEIVAYHERQAELTPGWRVEPVPSERFLIVTSSDDKKFLETLTERLEQSRDLFERDFPPEREFKDVSVIRVCGSEEEFHKYGDTSPGVAGWFNPLSTELVVYNSKAVDPNMTWATVTHEAFHQYCHFLFGQSEAHRWFDEGHGDYYGAAEFKRRRIEIGTKMPAGLNRYDVIKQMVREETYAPIERHVNASHPQWQNQGPSNVSPYAQSWSIVYMLRQGMLGEVPRKCWREEYGAIIPSYVGALYQGFQAAYAALLAEREAEAAEEGRELSRDELEINRFDLDEDTKRDIWRAAIDASWGQVDLDAFQEDWLTYVNKYL